MGLYHLPAWPRVIGSAYGHKTYCLTAAKDGVKTCVADTRPNGARIDQKISGVLPLTHLKSLLFGNDLISMPFFDSGGIAAEDPETEKSLLREAVRLGRSLKAKSIQLRQAEPLLVDGEPGSEISSPSLAAAAEGCTFAKRLDKARMILELPGSSEALMAGFKSKLRSQVKKPIKEGLVAKVGGLEFLESFYKVFCINMRDLGSPVHSKLFIRRVLEEFPDKARICVVFKNDTPLAAGILIGCDGMVYNPWASSLKEYSRLSPNMLLYWTMLQYACDSGYRRFDFGRSSIEESTYKFKEQWGAKPKQLYWYYIHLNAPAPGRAPAPNPGAQDDKSKFDLAIRVWQKMPVRLTQLLGPSVRKYIGL